jgi:hypothetical protein
LDAAIFLGERTVGQEVLQFPTFVVAEVEPGHRLTGRKSGDED